MRRCPPSASSNDWTPPTHRPVPADGSRRGRAGWLGRSIGGLSVLVASILLASAASGTSPASARVSVPAPGAKVRSTLDPLPPALAAAVSETIGAERTGYHATRARGRRGVRIENEANGFAVDFTRDGFVLQQGTARFGLALHRIGRGTRLEAVTPAQPVAEGNRVEYRRGRLTEWYANGPLGLEQGFTLEQAPRGRGDGAVTLAFALEGDFVARLEGDGRGLGLERSGSVVMRYAGLLAVDAAGRELPASLALAGGELRLQVDDAGATYPVTIDPVIGATKLNHNQTLCPIGQFCQVGGPGDRFGYSVAISSDGNTVAVAAPYASGSNAGSGAVYVFRKPNLFGWGGCITVGCLDYVAKLTSTPGLIQAGYGASVAISGDGNTIAVLTDTLGNVDSAAGIVYVYVKPVSGWASTGQHAAILSLTGITETPCGLSGNPTDCQTDATSSIAINGDGSTIVLGYTGALVGGLSRGAAYVFVRPIGGWVNSASPFKLTRSGGGHRDLLGLSVAISADDSTIVATAPQANAFSGVVDLFLKNGSWASATQSAELSYAPGSGLSFLGNSVDTTGNGTTVVVGGSGRVLVFPQPLVDLCSPRGCIAFPLWVDTSDYALLTTSDGTSIARPRISSDGTRIVASDFESPGSVYAFLRPATGWDDATEGARFGAPDAAPGDQFGYSTIPGTSAIGMSSNASVLLIGAPAATVGSNANQGAAYLFLPEPQGAVSAGILLLAGLVTGRRRGGRRRDRRCGR